MTRLPANAACSMVCRIRLYANRQVQISLQTISGVLQRSRSIPKLTLRARISSSVCHSYYLPR